MAQYGVSCGAGAAMGAGASLITGLGEATLGVGVLAAAGLGCVGDMSITAVIGDIGGPNGEGVGGVMHVIQTTGDLCREEIIC